MAKPLNPLVPNATIDTPPERVSQPTSHPATALPVSNRGSPLIGGLRDVPHYGHDLCNIFVQELVNENAVILQLHEEVVRGNRSGRNQEGDCPRLPIALQAKPMAADGQKKADAQRDRHVGPIDRPEVAGRIPGSRHSCATNCGYETTGCVGWPGDESYK